MNLTVSRDVDGGWKFFDFDFKSLLDIFKDLNIFSSTDKGNSKTFSSESSCSSYSVKI